MALSKLKKWIFTYVLHKRTLKPEHLLFSFKEHVATLWGSDIHAEPAVVLYLSIVDMHGDTIEAMSEVAAMLYKEYIATTGVQYLIVAGDAKTYLRLKELKQKYGSELDWLLPFVGDLHVLHNYQKVLMHVYFRAGLKDLAKVSGFRAETLTSLGNASNFKRTHAFLMQVRKELYRHCFDLYTSCCESPLSESDLAGVKDRLLQCVNVERCTLGNYGQATSITERECDVAFGGFMSFLSKLANGDSTWKFWYDF